MFFAMDVWCVVWWMVSKSGHWQQCSKLSTVESQSLSHIRCFVYPQYSLTPFRCLWADFAPFSCGPPQACWNACVYCPPVSIVRLALLMFCDEKGEMNVVHWIYMLNNLIKIIHKIASFPTFGLSLSTLYRGPIIIKIFYKKNVHGKYLSFATLGSYVACLGAKVFKFFWTVISDGFLAEDELRP